MENNEHIHPIFNTILSKGDKEKLLNQQGIVLWLVGLSGSGKSSLAKAIENELHQRGVITMLLDGDNLRSGLNNNLGFTPEDRTENIRRAAEVSKLFVNCGVVTICSLISPTEDIRNVAREIIGADYYEVYVNCPFEVCAQRDVKGLYQKAINGEIKNFTGLDAPFEAPEDPFLNIKTDQLSLEESKNKLLNAILPLVERK